MILRLNEKGSKQFDSSRFPYMEVVRNMEGLLEFSLYGMCVGVTTPIYTHNFLQKSFFSMAAALSQALPAFIQIRVKSRYSLLFPTSFTKNTK